MATGATLIDRVRRRVADWPEIDVLTASVAAGAASITVTSTTSYYVNQRLEIDDEVLRVSAITNPTTLAVRRGMYGSTDAAHVTASTILVDPRFTAVEILDLLNEGLDQMWPYFYRRVTNTASIVPDGQTEEFAVPTIAALGSIPIPRLRKIEIRLSGVIPYFKHTHWSVEREAAIIKFAYAPPAGATVRVSGYAPLLHFASSADTLDTNVPYNAENLPVIWAVGELLATGEAGRVRVDTGVIDTREQAVRPGSSLNVARDRRQAFYLSRSELCMPPMEPHIVLKD